MRAPTPNSRRWFVLGRESLIAAAEIDAVLSLKKYDYSTQILKVDASCDPKTLIDRLGGTIKIARELADSVTKKDLEKIITDELKTVSGKINFGISFYNTTGLTLKEIRILGLQIKKFLKTEGYSVRYVENKEEALSSVTVEKNGLTNRGREFLISPIFNDGMEGSQTYAVAVTEAVQPFEQFSARDFGRPGRDDLSGMLPPKLAIILINLAQTPLHSVLLDPFCGSGTILSEAMLLGYNNLIGADISDKAVEDTKINIEWVAKKFHRELPSNKIFQSEVTELSKKLHNNSIDSIVTEPYLGKPLRGQETKQELLSQAKQLKDLYLQAFEQFHKILKPKAKVVFIIPRFKYANEWLTIDCKNEIEKIGFTALPFFENQLRLVYSRPNQRVAREIWRFEKK